MPRVTNGSVIATLARWSNCGGTGRNPLSQIRNVFTDFHADYKVPLTRLGRNRNVSVILDVFNLFNRNAVMERDSDYVTKA